MKFLLILLIFCYRLKGKTHVLIDEKKKRIQVEVEKELQDHDLREWYRGKSKMENELQLLKRRVEAERKLRYSI